MGRMTKTPADRAADEVRKQRARLTQLLEERTAAEAQLAALRQSAPEAYLNEETDAARGNVARQISELGERVDIIGRSIPVQQNRVTAAESAYLTAKADECEKPAAEARHALERHRARTTDLLRQLEEHDGRYVSEAEILDRLSFDEVRDLTGSRSGVVSYVVPKSRDLVQAVERAERSVEILRAMADGRAPAIHLQNGEKIDDAYPGCVWGPDALVPAPAYLKEVDAAQHNLDTVEQKAAELEERLARTEERNAGMAEPAWDTSVVRGHLKKIPARRAAAAERLREVTSPGRESA